MCGCDSLDVFVALGALMASLCYPLLSPPRMVELDDMNKWGLKGPGTASLSKNMRGIYFLSGTKQPSKCNRTENRDLTLCVDGYHRSLAFGLDTSFCKRVYDYTTWRYDNRLIQCAGPLLLTSAHVKHEGYAIATILPLMRLSYTFDKTDPPFADQDPGLLGGAVTLNAFGVSRQISPPPVSSCPSRLTETQPMPVAPTVVARANLPQHGRGLGRGQAHCAAHLGRQRAAETGQHAYIDVHDEASHGRSRQG